MSPSRISFVAAGVILLLLVAVVVPAAGLFLAQSSEAERALAEIGSYRAKIAATPRLKATATAVAQQETDAGILIAGSSTSLAAANVQSIILDIVQRHGGQLRSSQALASSTMPRGLARIVVQYEVSLPPGALSAATYELESRTPYLFVDAAEIRPELYGSISTAPSALHVSWTIHAYRRTDVP